MADRTYTQIRTQNPATVPLVGTELMVVTQGGISKGALASDVAALNKGMFVCTSSTRPGAPRTGDFILETDTKSIRVWDGAAWMLIGGQTPYFYGSAGGN